MRKSKLFAFGAIFIFSAIILSYQNCAAPGGSGGLTVGSKKSSSGLPPAVAISPVPSAQPSASPSAAAQPSPSQTPIITTSPTPPGGGPAQTGSWQVVHDARDYHPEMHNISTTTSVRLVIHWAERPSGSGNLYNPPFDGRCYKVQVGDRIMFDSTPHGPGCPVSYESQCNYNQGPIWSATGDPQYYHVPKDDNGFLMRSKPLTVNYEDHVKVNVNGVDSNTICLTTAP
ncbi:MAG: hypothetical protein IT289_07450 [Oligoflexia bacterium]|nr:hypothetical protein [Oligoflexia bacterium]